MRPLESGTWILGAATLGALTLAVTSKHAGTKALLYNVASGAGVGAITMYLADLSDQRHVNAAMAPPRPPISMPIGASLPPPGQPPLTLPGGPALPPGAPRPAPAPTPLPTPPAPAPAPPTAPPPPAPAPAPGPAGPNSIGCTPLSGILPSSAVAQARALLALNPAATDARFRPTLLSVSTMRKLASDLRYCGSDLGFQPTRDTLVKDLEDTATRFETALGGPAVGATYLSNVLRFA